MDRWVKIVEMHCDPEERLNEFMGLLQDINDSILIINALQDLIKKYSD